MEQRAKQVALHQVLKLAGTTVVPGAGDALGQSSREGLASIVFTRAATTSPRASQAAFVADISFAVSE
jgi:hypothetical protein